MDLLLNDLVKSFLTERLKDDSNLNQSLLFWGESDLGKLTTAKLFAKSILCSNNKLGGCNDCENCKAINNNWHPDYLLIDTDNDNIVVDDTSPIFKFFLYKPQLSKKRILIINDCEKLNLTTQSSLLKLLEEPKNDFLIILVSSNPQKLLKTIRSRVIPIRFTKPSKQELMSFIESKYQKDIKNLDYLIDLAEGKPAKLINFIENQPSSKLKENNIQIYKNILKSNFVKQSSIIKDIVSNLKEKDELKNLSKKNYLKTLVNDWLSFIENELYVSIKNKEDLKKKQKQFKNALQLLQYIDAYNANYRLLLETFCLTTF